MQKFISKFSKPLLFIGVMISGIWIASLFPTPEKPQQRFVRKNAQFNQGQDDIEALNKALKIMKEQNCVEPTSWYYQAAIHWVPDTVKTPICMAYQDASDLRPGWNGCTHTRTGKEEMHFLVWHRLYIWHFEKIVRRLSGKKDFALPYWGYTESYHGTSSRRIPFRFRDNTTFLYEEARLDSLNKGFPIKGGEMLRVLNLKSLFAQKSYLGFGTSIDNGIHGAMHDYIGGATDTTKLYPNKITGTPTKVGLMGWVPTAAFDPIFWVHHANIDRLWAKWTATANGQNVTLEELKSYDWKYMFFDENGKEVVYNMEDIINIIYNMDYDYDDVKIAPSTNPVKQLVKLNKPLLTTVVNKIDSGTTNVILPIRASEVHKVSITVSFLDIPHGIYEVYLNGDDSPDPSEESLIGHMTFFGSDHRSPGETCIRGCCGKLVNGRIEKTFTYEITPNSQITDAVTQIKIVKWNRKNLHKDLVIENISVE